MSSETFVVCAKNLRKTFRLYHRPQDRLRQMVLPRLGIKKDSSNYYETFAALNGVDLTLGRGETVGIVGRNGSGKSTLLQIICGTLQPSAGEVTVNGRIAALLELGAGFNPDFTGRENVYLNGAIIGLSREEIEGKFDDIARFADIGQFIDQPTKSYSSGMYVRLAFAVAIHSEPDILIIDEALSVGDEAFQRKCFARIERMQARGTTILFVSHSAQTVIELCDRAVLLDGGDILMTGAPKKVVGQYQRLMNLTGEAAEQARASIKDLGRQSSPASNTAGRNSLPPQSEPNGGAPDALDPSWFDPQLISSSSVAYETQGAEITNPHLRNGRGESVNYIAVGRRYTAAYDVEFHKDIDAPLFGFFVKNVSGVELGGANNIRVDGPHLKQVKAGDIVSVEFDFTCNFMPGTYFVTVGLMAIVNDDYVFLHRTVDALAIHVMDGTNAAPCDAGLVALNTELRTIIIPSSSA